MMKLETEHTNPTRPVTLSGVINKLMDDEREDNSDAVSLGRAVEQGEEGIGRHAVQQAKEWKDRFEFLRPQRSPLSIFY